MILNAFLWDLCRVVQLFLFVLIFSLNGFAQIPAQTYGQRFKKSNQEDGDLTIKHGGFMRFEWGFHVGPLLSGHQT